MDFQLPKLSATMETAKVGRWFKKVGDTIKTGEPLVELETDKAALEVESPVDATVEELLADVGAELEIGAVLARLRTKGESFTTSSMQTMSTAPVTLPPAEAHYTPAPPVAASRLLATPLAKRLAGLNNIDLSSITGSGPNGRIRKRDVLASADRTISHPVPTLRESDLLSAGVERLSSMRSQIAASVTLSRQTIPSFVLDRWVETTAIAHARASLGPEAEQTSGIKLTLTDFLLQALTDCLSQAPHILDRYASEGGRPARIRSNCVDIGLVVAVADGVLIPVLRDLKGKSLASIAAARQAAVQRARSGRLSRVDYAPASISLSNIGRGGADRFEAIINPDQSSILAVGREHEKVITRGGAIMISAGINLTLSVDHRLIDGVAGAQFLDSLANRIQLGPWSLQ